MLSTHPHELPPYETEPHIKRTYYGDEVQLVSMRHGVKLELWRGPLHLMEGQVALMSANLLTTEPTTALTIVR
jgi:hypothetical protein